MAKKVEIQTRLVCISTKYRLIINLFYIISVKWGIILSSLIIFLLLRCIFYNINVLEHCLCLIIIFKLQAKNPQIMKYNYTTFLENTLGPKCMIEQRSYSDSI